MTLSEHINSNVAATPPLAVAGMNLFGYPVSDWVQCLAGIWLAVQIGGYFWSRRKQKD